MQGRICIVLKLFLIAHSCLQCRSVSPRLTIPRLDEYVNNCKPLIVLKSHFRGYVESGMLYPILREEPSVSLFPMEVLAGGAWTSDFNPRK